MGDCLPSNPYKALPGPELDAVIHVRVMQQSLAAGACPAYSTDIDLAKRVLSKLKTGNFAVIVGRTSLSGRSWFARFESNAMNGTEVFADTFELAICRLALLRLAEVEAGN